jgi:hypothetical protein
MEVNGNPSSYKNPMTKPKDLASVTSPKKAATHYKVPT